MTLRVATAADIPALRALERVTPTAAHWTQADYDHIFDPASATRLCLVIEDGGKLLAFLVGLKAGAEWEIENIVVAAIARRRRLGTRLLKELLECAKAGQAESVFLEVRESNSAARRFYETCGFTTSGRRTGYYSKPAEDAIVYRISAV